MGAVISTLLFQPPRPASYSDEDSRVVWLTCKGKGAKDPATNKEVPVQIPCVYLSYKGSDLVLLYSHGNATDLGQMIPYLELLRSSLKINVCSYEYQGYGISQPRVKCSEQRCYDSIEAAVDFLVEQKGHKRNEIIVFGTSLGSGPSVYITSKYSRLRQPLSPSTLPSPLSLQQQQKQSSSSSPSSLEGQQQQQHQRRSSMSDLSDNDTATRAAEDARQQQPRPVSARGLSSPTSSSSNLIKQSTTGSSLSSSPPPPSSSIHRVRSFSRKSSNAPLHNRDALVAMLDAAQSSSNDDFDSFRGLILQSGFTSVCRIKMKNAPRFVDMFLNIDRVDKVDCPTFIIHGKVDEVVPFEHAMILRDKLVRPYKPLFIDYAGHNNIMDILSVERYVKKLFEFIVYLNTEEVTRKQRQQQQQQLDAAGGGQLATENGNDSNIMSDAFEMALER